MTMTEMRLQVQLTDNSLRCVINEHRGRKRTYPEMNQDKLRVKMHNQAKKWLNEAKMALKRSEEMKERKTPK